MTLLGTPEQVLAGEARCAVVCADTEVFLKGVADDTFDGGVLDVPYGIGDREPTLAEIVAYLSGARLDTGGDFMGEAWEIPPVSLWREVFRVMKPGAWLAVFAATATDDVISLGLRAAGFERRDAEILIGGSRGAWVQAQGMKKGLAVGRAIDEAAGLDREVIGPNPNAREGQLDYSLDGERDNFQADYQPLTVPASDLAARWEGFDTDLAPKHEVVLFVRKPLAEVTSAELHAATGWNHWCIVRRLRKPKQRERAVRDFTVHVGESRIPPEIPEAGEAQVIRRRALHEGAESWGELRWRQSPEEPWTVLAMTAPKPFKPWSTRAVAAHVLVHGTGALNADAARVATDWNEPDRPASWKASGHTAQPDAAKLAAPPGAGITCHPGGRFPPNVAFVHAPCCRSLGVERAVLATGAKGPTGTWDDSNDLYGEKPEHEVFNYRGGDGTEEVLRTECLAVCECGLASLALAGGEPTPCTCGARRRWGCSVAELDRQSGERKVGRLDRSRITAENQIFGARPATEGVYEASVGGATRFYPTFFPDPSDPLFCYAAKAPGRERDAGLEERCAHVAVKPQKALRWLWRLVCPPRGLGIDTHAGVGSGPAAALAEGMRQLALLFEES
ncbi:MAG: hypothetical protein EKK55_18085 [Rhodocyclaceae bacterium]|nr:MAG: hypothetical protein EKK55_18085 [Rhodocyclaceae bacterium]